MPQGAGGAPGSFQRLIQLVTEGFKRRKVYVDHVIAHDQDPASQVQLICGFLDRLEQHDLKPAPSKARIGATNIDILGHSVSPSGVRPDSRNVSVLALVPMPSNISQLPSLVGKLSYYREHLPNLVKLLRPETQLLKPGKNFDFAPEMNEVVCPRATQGDQ